MSEWREVFLEEVASEITVGYVGPMASEYVNEGIPFLRSQNVDFLRIDKQDVKFITPEFHKKLQKSSLSPGDVVIVRTGKPGTCTVIPDWLPTANCSDLVIVRCSDELDARFLAYYVNSIAVHHVAAHLVGAVQQHFNVASARKMQLKLPEISEQRAITQILGTLDDKIELNRRMNETLEAIARAIFKSWFVDFDPVRAKAEGRDTGLPEEIADLFPDSFEETELGEVPKGWRLTSLGELFNGDRECVITGPFGSTLHAHDYREEGVPLILVKHVVDGHILDDNLPLVGDHKLPELQRYRLLKGDIVFTRVGAVGRSAYVHDQFVGWLISGQMLRIRIPDWSVLHPRYLAQLFLEKVFTDMVDGHALGTTRPSLNTKLLQSFRFIAPCGSLTQVFADKVEAFYAYVQNNDTESRTLAELRDTLLPRLISGELRVKEVEHLIRRTY